jgi:hypothetical protein
MFCQYKNTVERWFGKPFEGVHQQRIGPFAMVDTVGTIVLAALLSWWLQFGFFKTLLALCVLSVIAHWSFCIDTEFILYLKKVLRQPS